MRVQFLVVLALFIAPLLSGFDDDPYPLRHAEAELKALAAEGVPGFAARETLDPNQEQYDTRYLDLDIAFDTIAQTVDGAILIRVTVTGSPISTLVLDLDSALTVDGASLSATGFSHVGDLLTLTLDRTYDPGETLEIQVEWSGSPNENEGAFGFDTADGKPLIWSLSEPFGARTWYPIKDTPSDKADSASIRFTVPKPMVAVSNGTLENVVDLGTHQRFEWMERYPIAIYLISIAAHEYVQQSTVVNTDAGPLPMTNWSYASGAAGAATNLATTEAMMLAFEDAFGPYPFMDEKYDQAQFNWGGAMEHQTATTTCCWQYDFLTAHELVHQWFGDQVTCRSFTEIWVNEGFASWGEAYWEEIVGGPAAYQADMVAGKYLGGGTVRVPEEDLDNFGRIFSGGLTYEKGSWVVHMLRWVLGDEDFFAFLTAYVADPALTYGVAGTADVQRVAEEVSGQDLQYFFDQWIDQPWYPTYSLVWDKTEQPGSWDLTVDLSQLQTHHIYRMPVEIRVTTTGGTQDLVIDSDEVTETVVFNLVDEPLDVELDPNDWVLHAVESAVAAPSFDRGILLVNGVDIDVYGASIANVLSDSAATGLQPFEFWNLLGTPSAGYPAGLPAPRGVGAIPPDVLGQYSTVVWLGNNYNGDAVYWTDAAILDYLHKGGNVALLGRQGRAFLTQPRMDYLGVGFAESSDQTTNSATTAYPGLVPMSATGAQSFVNPLAQSTLQPETAILFEDSVNPAWALGAWRQPPGGGTLRTGGGHFVHIAGRPYRYDRVALRQNMEFILSQIIGEPNIPTAAPSRPVLPHGLTGASPNPFNPRVQIDFSLDRPGRVDVTVFDLRGRRVRTLVGESRASGAGSVVWDGKDATGSEVASGVYAVQFVSDGRSDYRKVTLVR
jgi:hypothetical protein